MRHTIEKFRRLARRKSKPIRQRLTSSPAGPKQTVFVAGVQRAGTPMVRDILEQSWPTEVFREFDPRAFDNYMMRPPAVIGHLIDAAPAPWVIVKALHEGHDLAGLLDRFRPAKAIWMFRGFDDMINSNMANWPGGRNQIEAIVAARDSAQDSDQGRARTDWRGRGMTEATLATVRAHYHPAINDASALGLFWFYRNQLFFDQGFEADRRVLLMRYESLVEAPALEVDTVARFLGLRPTEPMRRLVVPGSVAKRPAPEIEPAVRRLCREMLARLDMAHQAGHQAGQPDGQ
jgi:hypothetical protein